jgi:hypothetical protein
MFPVGTRSAVVFGLNAAGLPDATSPTTPYEGIAWTGPKAFSLTVPEPNKKVHVGADRPLAVDFLPPTDAVSGELRVSDNRYDIHALLTGTLVGTLGEAAEIVHGSSKQGFEPQVGLVLTQQALDAATQQRRWRTIVLPKAIAIPQPVGMADSPQDVVYKLAPQVANARLWGGTLVLATDGCETAQVFEYMTEGVMKVVAWKGNGSAVTFSFPAGAQAKSVAKIATFKNGVAVSSGLTLATSGVTFATAPASGDLVVVVYEVA